MDIYQNLDVASVFMIGAFFLKEFVDVRRHVLEER